MSRAWLFVLTACSAPAVWAGCGSAEDAALPTGDGGFKADASTDTGTQDGATGTDGGTDGSVLPDGTTQPDVVVDQQADAPPKCSPGVIECKSNVKRLCLDDGTWGPAEDCGAQICSTVFGCVVCLPGTGTCNGNTATQCKPDGSGFQDIVCDPIMGSTCDEGQCTGPCAPSKLGKSYIGCEYYPTVTLNPLIGELGGTDSFHYAIAVSNTSADPADILITQGANNVAQKQVAPGAVAVIVLPWTALKTALNATTMLASGAYRLRSTRPVTVYQFNPLEYGAGAYYSYTNDASLLLPVNAWGKKYVVAARNTWDNGNINSPGFYNVVASDDATTVTLTPSATGSSVRAGAGVGGDGNAVVALQRGDSLQVLSGTPISADVTGTIVTSDKPVQVIGGHACTNVPANITACDHLEESMFPISTLADEYIVTPPSLPTMAQPKSFFVRVIAVEPATNITYDPPNGGWPAALANTGDYVELDSSASFHIKATSRILVSQYMKGQNAGGGSGDPAQALAVTSAQFRKDYLFHAPVNYDHNYVNIIAPNGAAVMLDGAPVAAAFEPVGGTGFGVARVKFANGGDGKHSVTADKGVGITVYGYGDYTSYWYPGGLNLADL